MSVAKMSDHPLILDIPARRTTLPVYNCKLVEINKRYVPMLTNSRQALYKIIKIAQNLSA